MVLPLEAEIIIEPVLELFSSLIIKILPEPATEAEWILYSKFPLPPPNPSM